MKRLRRDSQHQRLLRLREFLGRRLPPGGESLLGGGTKRLLLGAAMGVGTVVIGRWVLLRLREAEETPNHSEFKEKKGGEGARGGGGVVIELTPREEGADAPASARRRREP
jgi:hypothetical protein